MPQRWACDILTAALYISSFSLSVSIVGRARSSSEHPAAASVRSTVFEQKSKGRPDKSRVAPLAADGKSVQWDFDWWIVGDDAVLGGCGDDPGGQSLASQEEGSGK